MVDYLEPREALKIVDARLNKDNKRFNRLEESSKIVGWSVVNNQGEYRIVTSKLYNSPPYERNKSRITIKYNDPKQKSLMRLNDWINKQ